jgi:hypothetical protein
MTDIRRVASSFWLSLTDAGFAYRSVTALKTRASQRTALPFSARIRHISRKIPADTAESRVLQKLVETFYQAKESASISKKIESTASDA